MANAVRVARKRQRHGPPVWVTPAPGGTAEKALRTGRRSDDKPPHPSANPSPRNHGGQSGHRQARLPGRYGRRNGDRRVAGAPRPGVGRIKNPLLQRKIAHLTRITAELQKTAMAMRLVPIGPLFRRMARLVRDLSRQFGKQVEMETAGRRYRTRPHHRRGARRSADAHGAQRHRPRHRNAGRTRGSRQAADGPVLLKAHHQAGQVVIEITDDGRGLDRDQDRRQRPFRRG